MALSCPGEWEGVHSHPGNQIYVHIKGGYWSGKMHGELEYEKEFSPDGSVGCDVWAVMEWECCIKSPEQGAKEGAPFIQKHIIEATQKSFDDFAGGDIDKNKLKKILVIIQKNMILPK